MTSIEADRAGEWRAACADADALIAQGDFERALARLQGTSPADDPSGESEATAGLACFRAERYADAARWLEAAVAKRSEPEWARLLAVARNNAAANIQVHVPPVYYYDRDALLGPPSVPSGTLPTPPPPLRLSLRQRACDTAGTVIGEPLTWGLNGATQLLGRIAGYRDRVWTNWYRRPAFPAVLTLAYMRERLNSHNLKSTYPEGALVGFQRPGLPPPPGATHFRTADGSWNNLENPKEGAAGTRFPRNVNSDAIRPERGDALLTPNPREVSRKLLVRGEFKPVPFLNMLAAVWINFQNHDWISHGENLQTTWHEVPLAEDDPARLRYGLKAMRVPRTQPDPTYGADGEPAPVSYINEVTHWWDGSQIYGSDQATQDRLRSHVDGKLRIEADGRLPLDERGVEETGFVRDWWVGLALLHTLFAREHNAICDMLKAKHRDWDDNRLFNVARLINAAVMAKIHSVEWTPAILPNRALNDALNSNWYGYLTNVLRRGRGKKTVAWLNVRNPECGGVVGNPIDKHGSPFGLTEEFVEVYRLHSLLPEALEVRRVGGDGAAEAVPTASTRQSGSAKVTARVPVGDLLFSFGTMHPGQLVLDNYPAFMCELSVPGVPFLDMGAVDILRARERGVPRYNEFRRQLGLNPIASFEDLTPDTEHVRRLKEVYGAEPGDVEKLDLMVGTLAEGHRPTGFGFGETMFQIFILNATRRLQADRFYTDSYNEETYTKEGLDWVDEASLKSVLLRHYPELAGTGLANVRNAFEPWDTDVRLDPARHPLRGFDKELGKNPWRGDAHRRRKAAAAKDA